MAARVVSPSIEDSTHARLKKSVYDLIRKEAYRQGRLVQELHEEIILNALKSNDSLACPLEIQPESVIDYFRRKYGKPEQESLL